MVRSHKRIENYYKSLIEQYPYEQILKLDSYNGDGTEEDWNMANIEKTYNFFDTVIPSMCSKYYVLETIMEPPRIYEQFPENKKFYCLFYECFYTTNREQLTFTTRQSLIRDIINSHQSQ